MEQGTGNKDAARETRGFHSLIAWQKADELASLTYRGLNGMQENRWLAVQTVRAAISVPANIAEGYGRGALGDYSRFLDIARGSLAELEYYLLFLEGEDIITAGDAARLNDLQHETARILHGLWRSLKQKAKNGGWDRSGAIREESAPHTLDPI